MLASNETQDPIEIFRLRPNGSVIFDKVRLGNLENLRFSRSPSNIAGLPIVSTATEKIPPHGPHILRYDL